MLQSGKFAELFQLIPSEINYIPFFVDECHAVDIKGTAIFGNLIGIVCLYRVCRRSPPNKLTVDNEVLRENALKLFAFLAPKVYIIEMFVVWVVCVLDDFA